MHVSYQCLCLAEIDPFVTKLHSIRTQMSRLNRLNDVNLDIIEYVGFGASRLNDLILISVLIHVLFWRCV